MPYEEFSVRVEEQDIERLHEILGGVSTAEIERLQANLECVRSRFYFSSILGDFAEGAGSVRGGHNTDVPKY